MKSFFSSIFAILLFSVVRGQETSLVTSGPMIGHTELRTSVIWVQFSDAVTYAELRYNNGKDITNKMELSGGEFNTATGTLKGLEPGQSYHYQVYANHSKTPVANGEVTTQELWQRRRSPPDFSFLTGSCAYFNEFQYDRPGKPYGGDSTIFETMAKENAAFTLWLGDNWYTRDVDYFSEWGLYYRASLTRSLPELQNLMKKMPQYAIWDDHDYGPNDSDKSYILKNTARDLFMKYWQNPSYGMNGAGTYTKLTWNDVDIFLLDDRWFRSNDATPDSINGKPNPDKKMLGDEQMEWLKNALLFSNRDPNISFRIIANGSQILNPYSQFDCLRHFPAEYDELLNFINQNQINSVCFLTGDRHHSEIIRQERKGTYPLYDITASPFTSGVGKTSGAETNNPARVNKEIDAQNYARFSFSGQGKERTMKVSFIDLKGNVIDSWSISLKDVSH